MTREFKEIVALNKEISDRLSSAGVATNPYRRAPLGTEVATITQNTSRELRLWSGWADVATYTDKRKKQAVITLDEKARSFEKEWTATNSWGWRGHTETDLARVAEQRVPITAPGLRTSEIELLYYYEEPLDTRYTNLGGTTRYPTSKVTSITVKGKISIPASKVSFLVGIDESAQFIAQLREHPTSVKEAHEMLRPQNLTGKVLRQGEWFFEPVTDAKLLEQLHRKIPTIHPSQLEAFSSHQAHICKIGRQTYATLAAWDTRKDRHKMLRLNGWYRVVRNREVNNTSLQQQRYWD